MSLESRITALAQALAADIKALRTGLAGKAASGANTDIKSITGSAAKLTTPRSIGLNGDGSGSVDFDGSSNIAIPLTLAGTGVTAGTYAVLTVDAKGRVTNGRILQAADLPKTGMPEGTWGVVATDLYGRVTAGRAATAADIVSGVLAFARLPVLGQVSSAGTAIVEVGANANGTWVRLAGGWQICWRTITTESIAANPKGLSPGYTWTFPAAFADSNWCGFLQNMSGWAYDYTMGFEGKASTYMGSIYIKNQSDQAHQMNHNIQCLAVGRCYY